MVLECKDVAKISLGTWYGEADTERGNDDEYARDRLRISG